jgi:cysteinyl-tRNA synthetase
MSLRIYNTLKREKQPFEPLVAGKVGMYVCGPTVYDMSHTGHARVYVVFDVVARYLRARGFDVTYVRNYTDVDDKIIKRANEAGVTARDLSEKYIREFQIDMNALGVERPTVEPKVSDHIPEVIRLIERIIANGAAYAAAGDVYFAVRKFAHYCDLSGRNLDEMEAGARVEPGEQKRDPLDFALWKAAKPGEPSWDSPWGKGRPGWHIECSAMSAKYLGETFDIHAGGMDLIFPHHSNEIAQSEAGWGKPFVRIWMHNGFVNINQEKMSKSLGNFFTIRQLGEKFDPEAIRYFLLGTHYRNPINFSDDALQDAEKRVEYLYETLQKADERLKAVAGGIPPGPLLEAPEAEGTLSRFREAMDDDFNTAEALGRLSGPLALIQQLVDKPPSKDKAAVARTVKRLADDVRNVGKTLGLVQSNPSDYLVRRRDRACREKKIMPSDVESRIADRAAARKAKDFARADQIRADLASVGVQIMDTPGGTTWKVV